MQQCLPKSQKAKIQEIARYIMNGSLATGLHYFVFVTNLRFLRLESAGAANFIAAIFGISASFLGSRYYVFREKSESINYQAMKFSVLYGVIAVMHGFVLLVWTDWYGNDHRIGFLIATGLQLSLSYVGNKYLVFKRW